ncbi:MAG: metallophosphoesterase family protein [Acidimicrobiales bacterium]
MASELTTVADDEAVVFEGGAARVYRDLAPDTDYAFDGVVFRTLPRPGELLCRFATVNDVHFGETECGLFDGFEGGPVISSEPGEDPYPVVMNAGAISEIAAIEPAALVVKGDLTTNGTVEEFDAFLAAYEPVFGERLHYVRGNHDSYHGATFASDAPFVVELPGVRLAVIDTAIPGSATGQVRAGSLEWLDELSARDDDRPIVVLGHHHPWNPDSDSRPARYFGIHPDDSEALVALVARRRSIVGYFAGHTHRNRVRRFRVTGEVPWVEVACVKDFPGAWAEYRVFEGGMLQVFRRISTAAALAWSEKTRAMFGGMYPAYAFGQIDDRCFAFGER